LGSEKSILTLSPPPPPPPTTADVIPGISASRFSPKSIFD